MTYHILFATNQAYLQNTVVSMHSILVNNKGTELYFHILHSEIDTQERDRIKEWLKVGFSNAQISFYAIEADQYVFPVKPGDAISKECYFRILASDVLPDSVRTVLYMDSDTICLDSIKELFTLDIDGYAAACAESKVPVYRRVSLGLKEEDFYFQSGVMLINLSWWREHQTGEQCLAFIRENPDILPRWDQDALNAVLAGQVKRLDPKWNIYLNTLPEGALGDIKAGIIHYTGSVLHKPWYKNSISGYQDIYLKYRTHTPYEKRKLEYCEGVRYAFWRDLVLENDRVVLCGAGKLGKAFYWQNLKNHFCEIVLWVDGQFRGNIMGRKVSSLVSVLDLSYEYVLLAVEEEALAFQYASELIAAGVNKDKILWRRFFDKKKITLIDTLEKLKEVLTRKVLLYGGDCISGSLICYCKREGLLKQILKIAVRGQIEDFVQVEGIDINSLDNLDSINESILIMSKGMENMDVIEELRDRGFKEIIYLTYSCCEELEQINQKK